MFCDYDDRNLCVVVGVGLFARMTRARMYVCMYVPSTGPAAGALRVAATLCCAFVGWHAIGYQFCHPLLSLDEISTV